MLVTAVLVSLPNTFNIELNMLEFPILPIIASSKTSCIFKSANVSFVYSLDISIKSAISSDSFWLFKISKSVANTWIYNDIKVNVLTKNWTKI